MRLKSRAIAFTLFMLLTVPGTLHNAFASGGSDGGGGGAFVCRENGKIKSAELLDLFEAREIAGQTINYDETAPVEAQVKKATDFLQTIMSGFGYQSEVAWKYIQGHQVQGSEALEILPPADAQNKFAKAGCTLEGMMYYDDARQKLVIKPEIFNAQASKTERAAAYVHEAVYKVLRDYYDAGDSRLARQLTGCAFAKDPAGCLNLVKPELPAKGRVFRCQNGEHSFTFYKVRKQENGVIQYQVNFDKISGNKFSYETSTTGYSDAEIRGAKDFRTETLTFWPGNISITGLDNLGVGMSCETPDISADDKRLLEYDGWQMGSCQVKVTDLEKFCKVVQ